MTSDRKAAPFRRLPVEMTDRPGPVYPPPNGGPTPRGATGLENETYVLRKGAPGLVRFHRSPDRCRRPATCLPGPDPTGRWSGRRDTLKACGILVAGSGRPPVI